MTWLALTRRLWVAVTAILLALFLASIFPRYQQLVRPCVGEACPISVLTPAEVDVLREWGFAPGHYAAFQLALDLLIAGTTTLLAVLIFRHRSGEWIGVVVCYALVLFGLSLFPETDGAVVALVPRLSGFYVLITGLAVVLTVLLFFLFPDGRFVPRWTGYLAPPLLVLAFVDPLFVALGLGTPSGQSSFVLLAVLLLGVSGGVAAQVYRYRRISSPAERQQTKWVVLGLAGMLVPVFAWALLVELFPVSPGSQRLLLNTAGLGLFTLLVLFLPISIVISILRYRLWDIDRLIRRTLIYTLLTGILSVIYVGSILLLQGLLGRVVTEQSTLVLATSTLLIAALFSPLRQRIQGTVDRRFYRRKYDAARTLAQFADMARGEVDVDRLTAELLRVVCETMQPAGASIWLAASRR